jgi:release factor glutamine methyltransferase
VNIADALGQTASLLDDSDVANARMDAAMLVSFATGYDKSFQIAHPEVELTNSQVQLLNETARRRAAREPLQYILGHQEFYGIDFEVTPDVLIPRPETEVLVGQAIDILKNIENPRFCDIGTGSGCIAISILHNISHSFAVGVDISASAITVAERNALRIGVKDRLDLMLSDVFDSVDKEKFDVIVSNPPYIPKTDLPTLESEVREYEPIVALTSGFDGLETICKLIDQAPDHLKSSGTILIEIGFDQSEKVFGKFNTSVWSDVQFLSDLQGIPRVAVAVKR